MPSFEFLSFKYAVSFPATNSKRFSYSLEQIFMLASNTIVNQTNVWFFFKSWTISNYIRSYCGWNCIQKFQYKYIKNRYWFKFVHVYAKTFNQLEFLHTLFVTYTYHAVIQFNLWKERRNLLLFLHLFTLGGLCREKFCADVNELKFIIQKRIRSR